VVFGRTAQTRRAARLGRRLAFQSVQPGDPLGRVPRVSGAQNARAERESAAERAVPGRLVHVHRVAFDDQHHRRVRVGEPGELLEEPPVLDRRGEVRRTLAFNHHSIGQHVVARGQPGATHVDAEPLQLGGNAGPPFAMIEEQHAL
jgi:hypothetical protein